MSACWIHPKVVPGCRLCERQATNLHPAWQNKLDQAQERGIHTCHGPWKYGDKSVIVNGRAVCGYKFYKTIKHCPKCGTLRD